MCDACGRYKDGGSGRKLYHDLPLPEDEVSTETEIVLAKTVNSAPRKDPIQEVMVKIGTDFVAKVVCDGGVYTLRERPLEIRELAFELDEGIINLPKQLGGRSRISS